MLVGGDSMNKGTLVRIKHNEHQGLFILMEMCSKGSQFVRLYSLKHNRICFDMVRSLEAIDAER